MVPYMSWKMRLVAWLLWRFEGFDSLETAEVAVTRPEFLGCVSVLRDYYYIKKAEAVRDE